jgi:hypothetical protein
MSNMSIIGDAYLEKLAGDWASNMTPQVKTNWNPYSQNFWGYNTQWAAKRNGAYDVHQATDQKIDAYNKAQWAKEDPTNLGYDLAGNKTLVNRGSTVSRNGSAIDIGNIRSNQRRNVIDTFDAIHRQGHNRGKTLPSIRPMSDKRSRLRSDNTATNGEYNPFLNMVTLNQNDFTQGHMTRTIPHEMSHWADTWTSRLLGGNSHNEFTADAGAYTLNKLTHPDSRMPKDKLDLLGKAVSAGKSQLKYYKPKTFKKYY